MGRASWELHPSGSSGSLRLHFFTPSSTIFYHLVTKNPFFRCFLGYPQHLAFPLCISLLWQCQDPNAVDSLKMEVGIEDCLHIEFEYDKSAYHLQDVVIGKVCLLPQVRTLRGIAAPSVFVGSCCRIKSFIEGLFNRRESCCFQKRFRRYVLCLNVGGLCRTFPSRRLQWLTNWRFTPSPDKDFKSRYFTRSSS